MEKKKKSGLEQSENKGSEALLAKYKPKKINSRKGYASAYILQILMMKTSEEHPLSRKEIVQVLGQDPYGVELERKSLGRIINGLLDSCIGICESKTEKGKIYFSKTEFYENIALGET